MDKKLGIIMSLLSALSYSGETSLSQPLQVLVVAPHPDDDIIGCGGSIAKHIKNGNKVAVVYMTSGEAFDRTRDKTELAAMREQEAQDAAKALGIQSLYFLRNPDGKLSYNQKNIAELGMLIRQEKPQIMYAPHAQDNHCDHKATYRIVIDAIKFAANPDQKENAAPWNVQTLFCYEVWTPLAKCSLCEDISEFITLKLEALRNHQSQIAGCRYDDAVAGLNRYRGVMGKRGTYCECFRVINLNP